MKGHVTVTAVAEVSVLLTRLLAHRRRNHKTIEMSRNTGNIYHTVKIHCMLCSS
jgi:hypothetical protein